MRFALKRDYLIDEDELEFKSRKGEATGSNAHTRPDKEVVHCVPGWAGAGIRSINARG
jgi:hypothetical protein